MLNITKQRFVNLSQVKVDPNCHVICVFQVHVCWDRFCILSMMVWACMWKTGRSPENLSYKELEQGLTNKGSK